jgi:hypothetical protein
MQKTLGKYTAGFGLAVAITIIFTSLLVVLKESSEGLKTGLASMLGHHWTTHGAITIIVLVILGVLLSRLRVEESIDAWKLTAIVVAGTALGGLIITGFFLLHL